MPRIHDRADLLDSLQETFVRAFSERARLSYDGTRPYRPFLLQIAKNLRVDQLRLNRREALRTQLGGEAQEGSASPLEPADPASASLSAPVTQEQREWQNLERETKQYLTTLSPTSRRFVTLRFEEAHSQADVAEIMQTTRRQVRTLEEQVQTNLKQFLKARGMI